jgi:RNA polymerase sigma factor (sigma-70 family)
MKTTGGLTLDTRTERVIRHNALTLAVRGPFARGEIDDLRQELRLGVVERAGAFDPSRASWPTFVDRVVTSRAANLAAAERAACRDRRRCVFAEDVGANQAASREEALDHVAGSTERDLRAPLADLELRRDVHAVVGRLPPDERRVCEHVLAASIDEAARALGRSRSWVYDALRRLREPFEDAGLRDYLATG